MTDNQDRREAVRNIFADLHYHNYHENGTELQWEKWLVEAEKQVSAAIDTECLAVQAHTCEVCGQPATRHGVEIRGKYRLTFGYFCDTCIAFPNSGVIWPENFETEALRASIAGKGAK